ncbi:hypothetical protein SLS56_011909 [Neofusicoccum ribis]|uniref:DUF7587 domain-containing protein n=1 Tax=Neofusicoccum ribis TaxID=45134 RepID=A0ABR3SBS7_9PEZI
MFLNSQIFSTVCRRTDSLKVITPSLTNAPPDARHRVPRYLFRAFSRGSRDGLRANNDAHIHPDDTNWPYPAFGDAAGTQHTLDQHLTWCTAHASEFTSWTSSLLCALRHAMRKAYLWREPSATVFIAVLDTANFALPVWPATALFDAYRLKPRENFLRHYYVGEYLVRGGVSAAGTEFRVASLDRLRDAGLHGLLPELFGPGADRATPKLACRIRDDRDDLCRPYRLKPLTRREMALCRRLGECFAEGERGGGFVFPVAAAFLALRQWADLFGEENSGRAVLEREILDELEGLELPDGLGGEEDFRGVSESHSRYIPEEATLFRTLCQRLIACSRDERTGDREPDDGERDGVQDRTDPAENDVTAHISELSSSVNPFLAMVERRG